MDYVSFFIKSFITIFVIVDPPGNIPLYIALTNSATEKERNTISKKATLIGGVILIFMTLTGGVILDYFKVTIDGLRIAGGILLFIIAVDILTGNKRKRTYMDKEKRAINTDSLATFPIALPLYTGPGAITAGIVLFSTAGTTQLKLLVLLSIVITYLIVRITHIYRDLILKALGKSGANIFARVMTIFIAAIAVEYFFTGLMSKLALIP